MKILKSLIRFLPTLVGLLPIIFIIIIIIFLIWIWKAKVKIKFRTFFEKGFRPERGNFGLYVYCGKQGTGKTYSLVEYLLDNKDNITVFNNVAKVNGLTYVNFTGFKELLDIKKVIDYNYSSEEDLLNYTISLGFDTQRAQLIVDLMKDYKTNDKQLVITYDEIFTELIKGSKLSKEVMDFLCQMRKRGIIFLTTCQEWAELPLSFRRFCRYQIDCRMVPFLRTGFLIKRFRDAENMKWSNDEQEHVAPLVDTTITKCRLRIAESYDTFLRISSVIVPASSATTLGNNNSSEVKNEYSSILGNLSNLKTE